MFSQAEFQHRNADGTGTRWKDIWSDGVDRSCTTGMGTKPLIKDEKLSVDSMSTLYLQILNTSFHLQYSAVQYSAVRADTHLHHCPAPMSTIIIMDTAPGQDAGFIRIPRKIFVLKKIFALILHFEFYRYIILVLTFYNHIIIALEKPNINILLLEILKSTIDT